MIFLVLTSKLHRLSQIFRFLHAVVLIETQAAGNRKSYEMGASEPATRPKETQSSLIRRTGWQTIAIMTTSMVVNLAIVGFVGFLWFADLQNKIWYRIMIT